MPVSFSYSAASFWEKKSSNGLMNELSLATVSDLVAAPARRGASAAAAPPARAVVRNSRRVLMEPPPRIAGLAWNGSRRRWAKRGGRARGSCRTNWIDEDQALAPSVPPKDRRSAVCGTVGPLVRRVKAAWAPGGLDRRPEQALPSGPRDGPRAAGACLDLLGRSRGGSRCRTRAVSRRFVSDDDPGGLRHARRVPRHRLPGSGRAPQPDLVHGVVECRARAHHGGAGLHGLRGTGPPDRRRPGAADHRGRAGRAGSARDRDGLKVSASRPAGSPLR